jgi:hypothetical protein
VNEICEQKAFGEGKHVVQSTQNWVQKINDWRQKEQCEWLRKEEERREEKLKSIEETLKLQARTKCYVKLRH